MYLCRQYWYQCSSVGYTGTAFRYPCTYIEAESHTTSRTDYLICSTATIAAILLSYSVIFERGTRVAGRTLRVLNFKDL